MLTPEEKVDLHQRKTRGDYRAGNALRFYKEMEDHHKEHKERILEAIHELEGELELLKTALGRSTELPGVNIEHPAGEITRSLVGLTDTREGLGSMALLIHETLPAEEETLAKIREEMNG